MMTLMMAKWREFSTNNPLKVLQLNLVVNLTYNEGNLLLCYCVFDSTEQSF